MKFVLASQNKHKATEIKNILGEGFEIITMDEILPEKLDIDENGSTFSENALIKARAVASRCNLPVISDDSGLCVDALSGAPGVHTARYAGENASDEENIDKLLSALSEVPKEQRSAHFACCAAVVFENGEEKTFMGRCDGYILNERRGENGFGYDPIFFVPEFGVSMAELPAKTKNEISHRSRAFESMKKELSAL